MVYMGFPAAISCLCPRRGNYILGLSGRTGSDGIPPYTTLSYGNGIGYYNTYEDGVRKDVSALDWTNRIQPICPLHLDIQRHGGDDVGVYASGPWSHSPYVNDTEETCGSGGRALELSIVVAIGALLMRCLF